MERIQAAIAKARAARRESAPSAAAARGLLRTAPAQSGDRSAAWAALPQLAPDPKMMDENRIVSNGKSAESSAFDVMRTRALKLMKDNGWKRLAITSPTAGCGKSTVAINLGYSLARRDDVSVILFEADMRRPSLARKLGITRRHMAANVLRGTAAFEDNACRLTDRLAVASNAGPVANPSDLLQGPQVGQALRDIEEAYAPTAMLFDMPPLLVNDDTIAFLQHVDCVILVAAAEHSSIKEIDDCERELAAHTNVMGVVLNKCRFTGRKYGYDYYG